MRPRGRRPEFPGGRGVRLLILAATLVAHGAAAQDGPELSMAFGLDGWEYRGGSLQVEGRFSVGGGSVAHQVGVSFAAEDGLFYACLWGALTCGADDPLITVFYEPHLRRSRGPERASPYIGLRVTVARGWGGFGGGAGLVAGVEGAGQGFRRFDLIVDYLRMGAIGSSGRNWSGWRLGLRYGRGLRLRQQR